MKAFLSPYILLLILLSCSEGDSNQDSLCAQEMYLLKDDTLSSVDFDFSLTNDYQFNNIQSQLPFDICNGVHELNAKFLLAPEDMLEAMLIVERICEENLSTLKLSRLSGPSIQILINKKSQIIVENYFVNIDSLENKVTALSQSHFKNNEKGNRYLLYQIKWGEETPLHFRKKVFKITIDGYLSAINDFAESIYQRGICELEDSEIQELKRKYKMAILLRDILPPPSVPKHFEIVPDSFEQEIEEEI